jgi:TolA-binding protein
MSLADLLLDARDTTGALAAYEMYLNADPKGALVPEALLGKARTLGMLGQTGEAEAAWRELVRRYPDCPYVGSWPGNTNAKDAR